MRTLAQSTAGAVAASVLIGLLGSSSLTVHAQPVATPTPDTRHAIYVDSASPDRNEQFLCGKTVVVTYNGLRYSNAQLAVAHSYSLPTTISLFGNLAQAANIPDVSTPAGKSGGPNPASPAPESRAAADAVNTAIKKVNAAQKLVAALQKDVTLQAATVEGLVLEADRPEIVREAALGNNTSDDIVSRAHAIATSIDTTKWWPTSEIIDAVQAVQLAKATKLTPDQTNIVGDLAKAVTAMLRQMTDPADATTLTIRSLIAWKQLLGKIRSGDFLLQTTVRCPPGAYADNAAVSFVAVDRTLAVSAPSPNGNANGTTPAGAAGGAGAARTELGKNSSTSNANQNTSSTPKQSTSISKAVAVVDAPSRLTATQGVGYSAIPNETFQTGTTLQNGANVTQVQNARSDAGQAFLMTTLVHYRFNNPGPIGIHATVGLTTSKNQLVNGVAGASLSFNQAMYFTVGVFRADTTSLTGYSTGQIVPSGTTLPTKAQSVNRVGFAISIPIFPGESGKGKPPATAAPTTPAPATSTP